MQGELHVVGDKFGCKIMHSCTSKHININLTASFDVMECESYKMDIPSSRSADTSRCTRRKICANIPSPSLAC